MTTHMARIRTTVFLLTLVLSGPFGPRGWAKSAAVQVPKPGVYDTFEAVQANQPSRILPARLKPYTHHVVGFFRATEVKLYQLDLTRQQARALGSIFALSDGVKLYLHPGFPRPVERFTNYVPMEPVGPYLYGKSVSVTTQPHGESQMAKEQLLELLFDTRTGRFSALTTRSLRVLMSDDPELLTRFGDERGKGRKLKQYLFEYVQRHPSDDGDQSVP